MIWFLTWHTYGTYYEGPPPLKTWRQAVTLDPPYVMDGPRRRIVLEAVQEGCATRGWELTAVHVRTNHVHAMVAGTAEALGMLRDLKGVATRNLRAAGLGAERIWAHRGSYRRVQEEAMRQQIINYIVEGQGEAREVWVSDGPARPIPSPGA